MTPGTPGARTTDADDAIRAIPAGANVFVGTGGATPRALTAALETSGSRHDGVTVHSYVTDGMVVAGPSGSLTSARRHSTFFVSTELRHLVATGRADYVPMRLRDVPGLFATRRLHLDAALIAVAPPDDQGRCSLGVSVDVTLAAARAARLVIAEVNPAMPRTRGHLGLHVDEIDAFVPTDAPLGTFEHPEVGPAAEAIARYVSRLVGDGATLQIGMGRIPNELCRHLGHLRDLGIHSDVITDGIVDLVTSGVVTGARKSVHPGKIVASTAIGTAALYDLMRDDDRFWMAPIEEVADPGVIAANAAMVSVTQAFALDLTGQVCADRFEGDAYGGVATQPDFHRGAAQSPGGRALVCLTATDPDGASRIRVGLRPDEAVAIPRHDTRTVVTEHGYAHLRGLSLRERALALIEIAAPEHRDDLLRGAVTGGLVPARQRLRSRSAYPVELEDEVTLRGGATVRIRPTRSPDASLLQRLFHTLSPEQVYTRFFTSLTALPISMATHLTSVDYLHEMALIAVVGSDEDEEAVATASYAVDPDTNTADIAFIVRPDHQGRGLAGALLDRLIDHARRQGLAGFTADVVSTNRAMLAVLQRADVEVTTRPRGPTTEVSLRF